VFDIILEGQAQFRRHVSIYILPDCIARQLSTVIICVEPAPALSVFNFNQAHKISREACTNSNMADNIPGALKEADPNLFKIALRGSQMRTVKPIMAYWCNAPRA
jgi:hypothetical protein